MSVKPPLGLRPRYIAKAHRMNEIKDAVVRYMDASLPVPTEWLAEYNELVKRKEA